MFNKILLALTFFFLLLSFTGWLLPGFTGTYLSADLPGRAPGIAQLLAIVLLAVNGTTIYTLYGKIMLGFVPLVIIGSSFKIMHWPGADLMLGGSLTFIGLVYLLRFFVKKEKNHLDILKLLWVCAATSLSLLILFHYLPVKYKLVSNVLFWLVVADFLLLSWKKAPVVTARSNE